jgi:hypothetical protein
MGPNFYFRVALGIPQKKELYNLVFPQLPCGADGVLRDRVIKIGRIDTENQIARIPTQLDRYMLGGRQWPTVPITLND